MLMIEYTTIDKSQWPPGSWRSEPDKVQFSSHGLACLVLRNSDGALCGYVGVDQNHPLYTIESTCDINFDVHGGITYVCESELDSPPDCGWTVADQVPRRWFGFDCAHWSDLCPHDGFVQWAGKGFQDAFHELVARVRPKPIYLDIWYVKSECRRLSEQISNYPSVSTI